MKTKILFIFLLIFFLISSIPALASERKKILIISSYHKGYDWSDEEIQGIEETFYPLREQMEVFLEYMDTKRIKTPEYQKLFQLMLEMKYADYNPDVIIVLDDNAFRFIVDYSEKIFGHEIPIVFLGVNEFSSSMVEGHRRHVTGVVQSVDLEGNIKLALKLKPKANPIVVVIDDSTSGKIYKKQIEKLEKEFREKNFVYINTSELTFNEMISKLKEQPKTSVGLLLAYTQNKDRKFLHTQKGYEVITEAADFPFFGVLDMAVEGGSLGGKVQYGLKHGKEAAEKVLQILQGKNPGDIPIKMKSEGVYLFNYKPMTRFRIKKSQLPSGTLIINEPESFYYKYKKEIWLIIITFIFLVASIVILNINISRRKVIEKKLIDYQNHLEELVNARTQELKGSNEKLTETLKQLTQTQTQLVEAEKMAALGNLIAGVAHQINTPVGIGITAASHLDNEIKTYEELYNNMSLKKSDMEELLKLTGESSALILRNMKKVRSLIETFKLVAVENSDNQPVLINVRKVLMEIIANPGYDFDRDKFKINLNCDDNIYTQSYRLVFEEIFSNLIINSLRHGFEGSEQGNITIDIESRNGELFILFKDDGKGINEKDLKHIFEPFYNIGGTSAGIGLGLHIVYNLIVHTLKGIITCESSLGNGCEFSITIPLQNDSSPLE